MNGHDHAILFYDGTCGLCHRAVRFVLWAERDHGLFRFAPLDGATFRELVSEAERSSLPDSLVVRTPQGTLLTRSAVLLYVLEQWAGGWRILGRVARLLPAAVRDALYDFVARHRFRFFARPADVCPLVPEHLRSRFLP